MIEHKYAWHCPHCGKVILKSKFMLDGFTLKCYNCKRMVSADDILYGNKRVIIKVLQDIKSDIKLRVIHR